MIILTSTCATQMVSTPKVYAINHLITYKTLCTMTTPAAVTKSIGLLAFAQLSWFLPHHLDSFTVIGQILPIYRDSVIWTTLSSHENPVHLPGLCKNTCQPGHRRQLPIPPGRQTNLVNSRCAQNPENPASYIA